VSLLKTKEQKVRAELKTRTAALAARGGLKPWEVKPLGGQPGPGISAADLVQLDLPEPKFAVPGLICEGLTILGGRPKQGKSWLSLLVSWAAAGGHDLDGRPCAGGAVLYLALEDTKRRLKSRLLMLGPAVGWAFPPSLTLQTSWPRAAEGGLYYLAEWLSANKDTARLVIIDTLAKFRTGRKGNGNSYDEDYEALSQIKQLADLYGVAVLVIHHTRKLPAEDPFEELSGTLAISGAPDGLLILDRRRGADEGRLYATGRDVPESTTPLALDRSTWRWRLGASAEGIDVAGRHVGAGSNTVDQCVTWLREYLGEYAYPSKEIVDAARKAGFKFSALRDAKTALGKNGTGELVSKNFGGDKDNDWWNGFGPWEGWKRRPEPREGDRRTGGPEDRNGQANGQPYRDRRTESADGPELWPG